MRNFMNRVSKGMSLVEITIVLTVLLVVFGAVFLFFSRGSEEFDFSRRQNELITIGRLALEEVTDIMLYAGYMPTSHWDNDQWHPVVLADSIEFEFYADYDANSILDDTDYRNIKVFNQRFVVTDHGGYVHRIGSNISSLDFNYLDELSNPLPEPLSELDRDLVRHIQIHLTMVSEYRNTEYFTQVSTTISPRNLGINHNINPAFVPPDPLVGTVVFNVCGVDTFPLPNIDEDLMINRMIDWGLTVIPLTDDQMSVYDFVTEETDLIVLRYRDSSLTFPYPALFNNFTGIGDTLEVPIVTLNGPDAVSIFSMAAITYDLNERRMTAANNWHPVNKYLPAPPASFPVYSSATGMQSVLDSLIYKTFKQDTVHTYPGSLVDQSGICVRDELTEHRRIHFSAHDASEYSKDGWQLFYNVIKWSVGEAPLIVELESFEDEDDYSYVEPGYGENSYCYVVSPMVTIPPSSDANYEALLRFSHCYWTRNRACGGYIEIIATDSAAIDSTWKQIPTEDLLVGYYHQQTSLTYPGGIRDAYIDKSPGYSPTAPTLTIEEANLEDYRGMNVWFRWAFGVEDKQSNNQDGWIIDDLQVLLVDRDPIPGPDIRLDHWADPDSMHHQPRRWKHHEFPTFNDDWYYHDLYAIDPIYPHEQGYAWTTWGEIGYIGPWTHGGINDSWEIGKVSIFTPVVDPDPTPYNGAHYAGNDLTFDDGMYNNFESSYLLSERWDIDNVIAYNYIELRFYSCIRLALNDDAFIHIGFSVDSIPPDPMDLGQWEEVMHYPSVNDTEWANIEPIELSDYFADALADSLYEHYWIIFSLITTPSDTLGGWNIDNITVLGSIN
ncbi:MAG: hypothetical protein ABFR50_08805 [Candidatus Fermentibacteria bacterium]